VPDLSAAWRALGEWTASAADLTLSAAQLSQLRAYLETLLLWNRKLALVSQQNPAQIITKHIADSLFIASRCTDGESVADLGSGAGLPGLPIAIARPSSRVCLVESRGRKVSFLEEARRIAAVRNAQVCHARIETLASDPTHRGGYAVVTARALTSLDEFLALARPLLAPGGRAIAMRAIGEDESSSAETIHYELPDRTPRRLLLVKLASR
jgi:16S rRNA (guanine527-N7)-methyltransferase